MRLIRYGLLFLIIVMPFLLINYINVRSDIALSFKQDHYENVLNNAIDAATLALIDDGQVSESDQVRINKEKAVEVFFDVLSHNFNIVDPYERENLKNYVPIILIIDYDGVYAYSQELYLNDEGLKEVKAVFHEKQYFSQTLGNQIITMSLVDSYRVIDFDKNMTFRGSYLELKELGISPFFDQEKSQVDLQRQTLLTSIIENELLRINDVNSFARIKGASYNFYIPDTKGDLRSNTIDSIGIMAVIQGMPMGIEAFDLITFSATGIKETRQVDGYDHNGELTYHEKGCSTAKGHLVKVFKSDRQAAREGYYPHFDCVR